MFRSLLNIKTHIYFTLIQYAEIENTCMFSISAICLTKNIHTFHFHNGYSIDKHIYLLRSSNKFELYL